MIYCQFALLLNDNPANGLLLIRGAAEPNISNAVSLRHGTLILPKICCQALVVLLNMFVGFLLCTDVNMFLPLNIHTFFVAGNFGEVHIGQLKDEWNESESTLVAIKTIRGVYNYLGEVSLDGYLASHTGA